MSASFRAFSIFGSCWISQVSSMLGRIRVCGAETVMSRPYLLAALTSDPKTLE